MAVIQGHDYHTIAEEYGTAYSQAMDVKSYLFDAVYTIVMLQTIIPEVDLLESFWASYSVNAPIYTASVNMLAAVRTIQSHVLIRGKYTTIDAYLAHEGIKVPASWAVLSAAAGYSISSGYIE